MSLKQKQLTFTDSIRAGEGVSKKRWKNERESTSIVKPENAVYSVVLGVRLLPEQKECIKHFANKEGVSSSEYVRVLLEKHFFKWE